MTTILTTKRNCYEDKFMDLISVCIPTYNSEKYIEECINSVLSQTYQNIEIIVSDNNSQDNTLKVIKSLNIENIKININKNNVGMVENFNILSRLANGHYIKFLCSDDKLEKTALELSVRPFKEHKNLVLVATAKSVIDADSQTIFKKISNLNTGVHSGEKIINKILYSSRNPVGEPSAVLVRKDIFKIVNGFKSYFPMTLDIDFWISVLKHGDLYFINDPLASFRVHKDSYSIQKQANKEHRYWIKSKKQDSYINSFQYVYILTKFRIINYIKKIVYFLNVK